MRIWLIVLLSSQVLLCGGAAHSEPTDRFIGRLVVESLPDGRNLRVVEKFSYIDPTGTEWLVPADITTDGASVPRAAWVLFPPFTGKYRIAAVVHDHFCQSRSRTWKHVHRMFYNAMISAGVDNSTAKTMFAAVWLFGPRWGSDGSRTRSAVEALPPAAQKKQIRQLEAWIKSKHPTPEQIESVLENVRK